MYSDDKFSIETDAEYTTNDYMHDEWSMVALDMKTAGMQRIQWTSNFLYENPQYNGSVSIVSVVRAGYDNANHLVYHVASSITNTDLFRELDYVLASGRYGIALVFDTNSEYVLACTDDRVPLIVNNTLIQLHNIKVREVKDLVQHIKTLKVKKFVPDKIHESYYFDGPKGSRYMVGAARVKRDDGVDWMIVYSLNKNKVIFGSLASFIVALVVNALLLILGLYIAIQQTIKLLEPIRMLQRELYKVQHMRLDVVSEMEDSLYFELSAIKESFEIIVEKLSEYRRFIPPHILDEIDGKQSAEEEEDATTIPLTTDANHSSTSMRRLSQSNTSSVSIKSRNRRSSIFRLGLIDRQVSIVTARITNMRTILKSFSMDQWTTTVHRQFVEQFTKIASNSRGTLKFFIDGFELALNANSDVIKHTEKACIAAIKMIEEFKKADMNMPCKIDLSVTVVTCMAQCGNIGSESNKKYVIWGPDLQSRTNELLALGEQWGVPLIVDHDVFTRVGQNFLFRPVTDHVFSNSKKSERSYELGSKAEKQNTEWMYELQTMEQNTKWKGYWQAYEEYTKQEYSSALTLYDAFLAENPDDQLVIKQMELCRQHMEDIL
jgi:hypothetical protein